MSDAEHNRERAARLFALALKAREEGNPNYADELTKLAAEVFDQAGEIERQPRVMPAPPAAEAPQQVAQQQQQPQPKMKKD